MYATIEDDILHFKLFIGDVYEVIMDYEETLGLIELARTKDYIIYKTDFSCPYEHLVLVGNNKNKSLTLKAQLQLAEDFGEFIFEE